MSHRSAILFSHLSQNKNYSSVHKSEKKNESKKDSELIDRYIKEINEYPILTKKEEFQYISDYQDKDCLTSRQAIIQSNLRLVVRIARRYHREESHFMDLIAEGNIGLLHALKKFDLTLGYRFSTYAAWWVQQYIETFLMNHGRTVRLPVHIQKKLFKLKKSREQASQKHQKPISLAELSKEMKLTRAEVDKILVHQDIPMSLYEEKENLSIEEGEETPFSVEASQTHQEHDYAYEQLKAHVQSSLTTLPSHYRDVIVRRFGLMGHDFMSFRQIGTDLGLSIDQVRQRYSNALQKLSGQLPRHDFS